MWNTLSIAMGLPVSALVALIAFPDPLNWVVAAATLLAWLLWLGPVGVLAMVLGIELGS